MRPSSLLKSKQIDDNDEHRPAEVVVGEVANQGTQVIEETDDDEVPENEEEWAEAVKTIVADK